MILAVAALLLHSAAVPQAVVTLAAAESQPDGPSLSAPLAASDAGVSAADAPLTNSAPSAAPVFLDLSTPEFDTASASYQPARTTPEPVSPDHPVTVIVVPVQHGSSSGVELPTLRAREQHRRNVEWWSLLAAEHGAATFDAWTTRRAISTGGGTESNPLLRPFANNGSLYAAIQVGPLVFDYVSRRMMHSEHRWMRRAWWAPQAASTVLSLAGGVHNLGNIR